MITQSDWADAFAYVMNDWDGQGRMDTFLRTYDTQDLVEGVDYEIISSTINDNHGTDRNFLPQQ